MDNREYIMTLSRALLEPAVRKGMTMEQASADWQTAHRGDMSPGDTALMGRIHEMRLRMLKRIDTLCMENGLEYWLSGTTLRDALLFGGPGLWTMDCTISMMRKDYLVLYRMIQEEDDFLKVMYGMTDNGLMSTILPRTGEPMGIRVVLFDTTEFSSSDDAERYWRKVFLPARKTVTERFGSDEWSSPENYVYCSFLLDKLNFFGSGDYLLPDVTGDYEGLPGTFGYLPSDMVFPLHRIPYGGMTFPIPNRPEEYHDIRYGERWLLPERWGIPDDVRGKWLGGGKS